MRKIFKNEELKLEGSYSLSLYLKEINDTVRYSMEEEKEIFDKIRNGDDNMRDMMIKNNLPFVINVAKHYQNSGVNLKDLINAGNEGLMDSVDRFDQNMGVKFITYAVWYIRQYINDAISESREVYVPNNRLKEKREYNMLMEKIIASEYDKNSFNENLDRLFSLEKFSSQIKSIRSLNNVISSEDGREIIDTVCGNIDDTDRIADINNTKDVIRMLLDHIPTYDSDIIKKYYGIDTYQHNINNISEELNVQPYIIKKKIESILLLFKGILNSSKYNR